MGKFPKDASRSRVVAALATLEYAAEAMAHETVHAVAEPDSA
jgi:hypothetical protein